MAAYAAEKGVTLQQAASSALAESRNSIAAAKPATTAIPARSLSGATTASSSGGGTRNTLLGYSARMGDLFVSPAATGFVQHGHTGIYYSTKVIVEAPGQGLNSRSVSAATYKVGKGAVKQYVRTTTTLRNRAASHAFNHLRGRPYNLNFAFNKSTNGAKMNCSQLVWAAYKAASNIDLDGNGGPGVYPYNIRDSSKTTTYKTL